MSDVGQMAKHTVGSLGIVAIAAFGVHAQAPHQYTSPDGKTVAIVNPVAGTKTNESEVRIYEVAEVFSTSRLNQSFASTDGEHGLVIVRSAWSPNSDYFVFSGESSRGPSTLAFADVRVQPSAKRAL
jgi:Tol biopolymer transport system component